MSQIIWFDVTNIVWLSASLTFKCFHRVVTLSDVSFAYGYRGSLLSRLAVASLHLKNHDIAVRCITERRIAHRSSMLALESAAIIRGLLRCHYIKEAWEVLEDELSLPLNGWVSFTDVKEDNNKIHLEVEAVRRQLESRERLVHRARSIGSIASRHFYEEEPTAGIKAIQSLKKMGNIVNEAGITAEELGIPWERLVRGAAQCESKRRVGKWANSDQNSQEDPSQWSCNIVYVVLDAMVSFPPENKDVTFEALCNALVRRTCFVTGAIDMNGCPEPDRGEVAFIGRSNVGKSSLVNMVRELKQVPFVVMIIFHMSFSHFIFACTVLITANESQVISIHQQNSWEDTAVQLLCCQ